MWENLADYQADVLATVAIEDGLGEFDKTIEAPAPIIAGLDRSTPEGRDRSFREVFRCGGAANIFALLESANWSLWIAVWATARADNLQGERQRVEHQERIRAALLEGYDGLTKQWEGAYASLAALLGMRVRAPLTMRQFTVAVGALSEGCSLRQLLDPHMEGILRPTGLDGDGQEWPLFGIGLDALQQMFFEPDPDRTPPPLSTGPPRAGGLHCRWDRVSPSPRPVPGPRGRGGTRASIQGCAPWRRRPPGSGASRNLRSSGCR